MSTHSTTRLSRDRSAARAAARRAVFRPLCRTTGVHVEELLGAATAGRAGHEQVVSPVSEVLPERVDRGPGDREVGLDEVEHRHVADLGEVSEPLRLPQREAVDEPATEMTAVLAERRGGELHARPRFEQGAHRVPGPRGDVMRLVDEQVRAQPGERRADLGRAGGQSLRRRDDHVGGAGERERGVRVGQGTLQPPDDRADRAGEHHAESVEEPERLELARDLLPQRVGGHQHEHAGQPPGDEQREHRLGLATACRQDDRRGLDRPG